jgi:hypothetical protein
MTTCDGCELRACDGCYGEHRVPCHACNELECPDVLRPCSGCGTPTCDICLELVGVHADVCPNCRTDCAECLDTVLTSAVDADGRCPACRPTTTPEETADVGDPAEHAA